MKRVFYIKGLLLVVGTSMALMGCLHKSPPKKNVQINQPVIIEETSNKKASDIADNYPAPWKDDFRKRIHKAIVENNVNNCKLPKHRLHISGRSYLIQCESSLYYVLWLGQDILSGPYQKRKGSIIKD